MSKKKSPKDYAAKRRALEKIGVSTKGFGSARTATNRAKLSRLYNQLSPVLRDPKAYAKVPRDKIDSPSLFPLKTKDTIFVHKGPVPKGGSVKVSAKRGQVVKDIREPLKNGKTLVKRRVIVVPAVESSASAQATASVLAARARKSKELRAISNASRDLDKYLRGKKGGKKVFGSVPTRAGGMSDNIPIPVGFDEYGDEEYDEEYDEGAVSAVERYLAEFEARYLDKGRSERDINWLLGHMSIGVTYVE